MQESWWSCVFACWRGGRPWCSRAVCKGRGLDLTTVRSILPHCVPPGTCECLSEEEGGYLGSRWTQCPAQAAGQRRDVEEHLEEWQVCVCGTIFAGVAPEECNTHLRQQSVGLRWDSSALPKVKWPVWTHGSSSSREKRQTSAEGSSPHGKISLTRDRSVTRPCTRCLPRWSECHLQRNGDSRTYFLLHPEILVYFLWRYSTELCYMRALI